MTLEIGHREVEGIEILDLKGGLNFGQEDLYGTDQHDGELAGATAR